MPLSKQQILNRQAEQGIPWVSPGHGDGGWHTTPGCLQFDPHDLEPLGDHILVELDAEPATKGVLAKPDIAVNRERTTRTGTVLKVGPGKRDPDNPRERLPMYLKPGQRVVVGHYSDWESWEADWEGRGRNVVIFQENDVRGTLQ